jgi:FixJ family two-component response regulator
MNAGVAFLDDDDDLRDALCEWIAFFGGPDVLSVDSVTKLRAARDEVLGCELAILDVNLGEGQPDGLDALAWLREIGFAGRIVFLTGHASNAPALRNAGVPVLQKPLSMDELRRLVMDGRSGRMTG